MRAMSEKPPEKIETGADLRDARLWLDLSMLEMGRALGLSGQPRNIQLRMSHYEKGHRPLPRHVILLTECFLQGARPSSWPG